MTIDLISNMLANLQNAISSKHSVVNIAHSNQCLEFIKLLYTEGLIKSYMVISNKLNDHEIIKIELRYTGHWILKPLFSKILRISKPGKRVYVKKIKLEKIQDLNGLFIISTSSGMMTHIQAYRLKKGGEVICYIS